MDNQVPGGSYLTPSFEHATAGDAMRPWVLTCTPETPLVTAAQRMAGEHVHALVVLAANGGERRPWAVLSDRELLRNADRAGELTAGDVASTELLMARPTDRLADVAERMVAHAVSHAVVVEPATERPVGVVSSLDVAGIIAWGRA